MRFLARALLFAGLVLTACNDSAGTHDSGSIDSGSLDSGVKADAGAVPHTHYVVSTLSVPNNNQQARAFGLDLNDDGTVDNQVGQLSATLAMQGLENDATQVAIDTGATTVLLDVAAADFTTATAASVRILAGSNPIPAACRSDAGPCRQHLDGGASFTVLPQTPELPALKGSISAGVLNAGPGDLALAVSILGSSPIALQLKVARVRLGGITASGVQTGIIAGGITASERDTTLYPSMHASYETLVARDCTQRTTPPGCGCANGSTGATLLGLFDADVKDCAISVSEIQTNALISTLFAPDLVFDGGTDLLSFGVQISAVNGVYTVAGE